MKGHGVMYLDNLFSSIHNQTFKDYEVVVSDHSQDNKIQDLCHLWSEKFSIKYIKCSHGYGNSSINTNNAIENAKGEFVKIMHQDDFFYSDNALEIINKELFEKGSSWGVCGFIHLNENNNFFKKRTPKFKNSIMAANLMGAPSVSFFKREDNLLDENLIWMNDAELYFRLNKKYGKPLIIKDILVVIRVWGNRVTSYLITNSIMKNEIKHSFSKHNLRIPTSLKFKVYLKNMYTKTAKKLDFIKRKIKKGDFIRKSIRFVFLELVSILRYYYHSLIKKDDRLTRLANRYRSDKGTRKILKSEGDRHCYTPIYNDYFRDFKNEDINFLEIGIGNGASIKIWNRYFKKAKLNFVDIDDFSHLNTKRIKCFMADQSNRDDLEKVAKSIGEDLEIIIDDGGHYMGQQQISFGVMFKYLKPGGIYFIEDLHTSYWPYNGYNAVYNDIPIDTNEDKSNSTINMLNNYIKDKKMSSMFLTQEENDYLTQNIESCVIFDRGVNKYGPNHLALITKKK